jgi:hypothetical protein
MSKQVWGTFSVKDHCDPNAFVAEVMLYDRLVIPVPPDNEARAKWDKELWQPDRLDKLLKILDERAFVVKWDEERRQKWRTRFEAGKDVAHDAGDWAFVATRNELTAGLPRNVTGIQAVTNYTSGRELEDDLGLKSVGEREAHLYGGAAVAIIGHEFLVPDDSKWGYEELLGEAVALSSEPAFRRKRASFWRWQREFLNDKGITDQSAIIEAVEEMQDLLEEEKQIVRRKNIRTGSQFAFLVGSVALGLLGGPLTAAMVGGAFLSVGGFVADKLQEGPADNDRPVSLLRDIRKHFGWR